MLPRMPTNKWRKQTRSCQRYTTKILKLEKQTRRKTQKSKRQKVVAAIVVPYMMIFLAQYVVIFVVFRVLQFVKVMISVLNNVSWNVLKVKFYFNLKLKHENYLD